MAIGLQLGAVRSEEAAAQEWERLKRAQPEVLGKLGFSAARADLGEKGIYYRIEAGPIADTAQARQAATPSRAGKSGASLSSRNKLPAVFGLAGTSLTAEERGFFRDADPLGFILFQRNCENPAQLRGLVAALRDLVGRGDAPVLIDQEGGRVARLKPPFWPAYPAPAAIAALGGLAPARPPGLARASSPTISLPLGITVDCAPVIDVPVPGADPIIGDRAWGAEPDSVTERGLAVCDGLMAGGVLPVLKHIPGHGRGTVDSHVMLPIVVTDRATLDSTDFRPFRALARDALGDDRACPLFRPSIRFCRRPCRPSSLAM